MKKLLTLAMIAGSIGLASVSAEANSNAATAVAASSVQSMQRRQTVVQTRVRPNGRVVRTVTRTRRVRVGGRVYRETYQTRYQPNGRVTTRVISRVRIR